VEVLESYQGENIYPRDVEELLHKHDSVAEAQVIGIPCDYYGERVAVSIGLVTLRYVILTDRVKSGEKIANDSLPMSLKIKEPAGRFML
jgi:acyl-CoA synthetase (AMP-forming)/AMP-acid ligase II